MNQDDDKELLIQTTERAKNNTHQINELKQRIDQIDEKADGINAIATRLEVLNTNITYIKDGQEKLSVKVDKLADTLTQQGQSMRSYVDLKVSGMQKQVDDINSAPYKEYKKSNHEIKVGVISKVVSSVVVSILTIIITLIATGIIKI